MGLFRIVARNIRCHLYGSLLLLGGLAVGVATVVAIYSISSAMRVGLENTLDEYGANIVVAPLSKSLPLSYGGISLGGLSYGSALLSEADAEKIRSIRKAANVNVVAPKLMGLVQVRGEHRIVVGVRFRDELKLKKWWKISYGAAPKRGNELLLAGRVASALHAKPGMVIEVGGRAMRVSGILERMGSQEDDLIYMDLKSAQSILNKPGRVSVIEVSAWCKNCPIDEITKEIAATIPGARVSAVRQAARTRDAVVERFVTFALLLSITMSAVATIVIFVNVLNMVRDRRSEIGIFRAVGFRRRHVLVVVMSEAVIMGSLAGLAGWIGGLFIAHSIGPILVGIDVRLAFGWRVFTVAVFAPIALSLLASSYPAVLAAQTDPSDALRTV